MTLTVAVGSYAKLHGGEFLFFMPSVRVARSLTTQNWRIPGYGWMLGEPRLLGCLFVTATGALLVWPYRRRWRDDAGVRLAGGLVSALGLTTIVLAVWEFLFHGIAVFDIPYYFSVFTPFLVVAAVAPLAVVMRGARSDETRLRNVAAGVLAAAAPTALVYGTSLSRIEGRTGFWCVVALASTAIIGGIAFVTSVRRRALAICVGIATICALNLSAATSRSSARFQMAESGATSFDGRRAAARVADDLIAFMRRSGLQANGPGERPANFWIDEDDAVVDSVQSSYLFGITDIGLRLPTFDRPTRRLLDARKPPTLVLLCRSENVCERGRTALETARYKPKLRASTTLEADGLRLFVKAYTLPAFDLGGPEERFYRPSQSAFVRPHGAAVADWDLATALPAGWNGKSLKPGGYVETSPRKWRYELQSPSVELPPGRYEALLEGRVLRGGLDLGVLDTDAQRWVVQRTYWHGQRFRPSLRMGAPFRVTKTTKVAIVLANWVPTDRSSSWRVGRVGIVRLSG